jgi:hypothetical protein
VPVHASFLIKGITGFDSKYRYYKSFINLYEKESSLYSDSAQVKNEFASGFNVRTYAQIDNSEYIVMYVPGQLEVSMPGHISYFPYKEDINDTAKFDFDLPLRITEELMQNQKPQLFKHQGIPYETYPTQPLYFEESWHWNKEGHRAV